MSQFNFTFLVQNITYCMYALRRVLTYRDTRETNCASDRELFYKHCCVCHFNGTNIPSAPIEHVLGKKQLKNPKHSTRTVPGHWQWSLNVTKGAWVRECASSRVRGCVRVRVREWLSEWVNGWKWTDGEAEGETERRNKGGKKDGKEGRDDRLGPEEGEQRQE